MTAPRACDVCSKPFWSSNRLNQHRKDAHGKGLPPDLLAACVPKPAAVLCDYCQQPTKLITGAELYPHRPDLHAKKFWKCDPCDAMVGCHPPGGRQGDGTKPLGRLANAELRRWKQNAHTVFDPLWRDGGPMSRSDAYGWLAGALGIPKAQTHIGMFDVDRCRAVIAAVKARRS